MRELRAEAGRWAGRASREDSGALLRTEIKVGLVALARVISYWFHGTMVQLFPLRSPRLTVLSE